jgi:catechol 2,3-dioxygenase
LHGEAVVAPFVIMTSLAFRHVELRVADLARSRAFYVERLGFTVATGTDLTVDLAVAPGVEPILRLSGAPGASRASPNAAGLFHAALLFPTRAALGSWLRHAASQGVMFNGASDHAVSEALYFSDPEGNGLEFYADRPRDQWPLKDGAVEMVTEPLDVASLLGSARVPSATPLAGASWGHLHLRVTDLDRSERFYTERLGLHVTQRTYPGARFLAADGYHHHVGLNVWAHPTASQPRDALGLAKATFALRGATEDRELTDPDAIAIEITPLAEGS